MERKPINYELYYRVPWPDSQKYMFTDCTTGDEVFTVDDDQAVYVPKSYIDELPEYKFTNKDKKKIIKEAKSPGEAIEKIAFYMNISGVELAKLTNMSKVTISNLIKDNTRFSYEFIYKICKALHIDTKVFSSKVIEYELEKIKNRKK